MIWKLTLALGLAAGSVEAQERVAFCGGGAVARQISYSLQPPASLGWDARVVVNGTEIRAMTAYSYFGAAQPPEGFVLALLGEDRSEFFVFENAGAFWIEYGDYRYDPCR